MTTKDEGDSVDYLCEGIHICLTKGQDLLMVDIAYISAINYILYMVVQRPGSYLSTFKHCKTSQHTTTQQTKKARRNASQICKKNRRPTEACTSVMLPSSKTPIVSML